MDITTTVSASVSILKSLKDICTSLLDAKIDFESKKRVSEILEKVGNFQDIMFELRDGQLKSQEENHRLKEQIRILENQLETREKVVYEKPFYWIKNNDTKDGPFCQRCYDVGQKHIRLQGGKRDVWLCHECKTNYTGPNYQPLPQTRRNSVGGGSWMGR